MPVDFRLQYKQTLSEPPRIITPTAQSLFTIDDLIRRGVVYYSEKKDVSNRYIGVPKALEQACNAAGNDGVIASLPYLIAGKAQSDRNSSYLWKDWFTALSEEHVGIDKAGKHVGVGKPLVMVVHGGGILTYERIMQAYTEGLTSQNAAKLTSSEFDSIVNGTLPNGQSIQIYTVDDIKRGRIADPFGRYAVALDLETAKATTSGYHKKAGFMSNILVHARAGTLAHLETYFDKAKDRDRDVGNHHSLAEMDPQIPQGRLLFLYSGHDGLYGDGLDFFGRFVGVRKK